VRVSAMRAAQSPLARRASDHLPLVVDFEIET
jgi:endonuclease/exonuclease/phosphatase family metal-dependent hydrolase